MRRLPERPVDDEAADDVVQHVPARHFRILHCAALGPGSSFLRIVLRVLSRQDFCGTVDRDKVFACLVKNKGGLSNLCSRRVGKLMEQRQHDLSINVDVAANCADDAKLFCAHTAHNKGLILSCLPQTQTFFRPLKISFGMPTGRSTVE